MGSTRMILYLSWVNEIFLFSIKLFSPTILPMSLMYINVWSLLVVWINIIVVCVTDLAQFKIVCQFKGVAASFFTPITNTITVIDTWSCAWARVLCISMKEVIHKKITCPYIGLKLHPYMPKYYKNPIWFLHKEF